MIYSFRWPICQSDPVKMTKTCIWVYEMLCHSHFWMNVFPSRKFSTMSSLLIQSPRYTRGDLMFLYWFVRRRRRRQQSLLHAITSEQLVRFLSFWYDWWTWPIEYLIRFWSFFVVTLTLIFHGQIWNSLYLGQKWFDCHKTNNFKPQMWPQDLTLAMTLTLNFQGQIWNLLYLGQKWSDCHQTKSKHIDSTLCLKYDLLH